MAVEIPNTEPAYPVNWRQNNPNSILRSNRKTIENDINKDDNNDTNQAKDIIYKNFSQRFNNDFKTTVSAFSTVVKAESSFREIKNNLYLMRQAANTALHQNINVAQKDKLNNDFNNYKNNIDNVYQKNEKDNVNFLDLLKDKGITYRINTEKNQHEITIALNKNDNEINGFNTNGLQIDNLTIQNDKEASNAINKIDNAINYIEDNEENLNKNQDKIDSLLNSLTNTDKIVKDEFFIEDLTQAKNEVRNISDIILGNKDEASKVQANTIYENYINLLKTTPDLAEQNQE